MTFDTSAYHYPNPWTGIVPHLAQGYVPPFAQGVGAGHGAWPTPGIGNFGVPVGGIPPQIALQSLCSQLGALSQTQGLGGAPIPSYGLPYGPPVPFGGIPALAAQFGGGFGGFQPQIGSGFTGFQPQLAGVFQPQLAGAFQPQLAGGFPQLQPQLIGGFQPQFHPQLIGGFQPQFQPQLVGAFQPQLGGLPGLPQQLLAQQLALAGLIGPAAQVPSFGRWPLGALGSSSYAPLQGSPQMAYTG